MSLAMYFLLFLVFSPLTSPHVLRCADGYFDLETITKVGGQMIANVLKMKTGHEMIFLDDDNNMVNATIEEEVTIIETNTAEQSDEGQGEKAGDEAEATFVMRAVLA